MPYLQLFLAYLIGSYSWGYQLALKKGIKPTTLRRGGLGATNMSRLLGRRYFWRILFLDAFTKGTLPTLIAFKMTGNAYWAALIGLMAVIGHCLSPWVKFFTKVRRWGGGKGVATALGVIIALQPDIGLSALALFFLVWYITGKRVSAGSLVASAFAALMQLWVNEPLTIRYFLVVVVAVIWLRHIPNIKRLLKREEPPTELFGDAEPHEVVPRVVFLFPIPKEAKDLLPKLIRKKPWIGKLPATWQYKICDNLHRLPPGMLKAGGVSGFVFWNGRKAELQGLLVPTTTEEIKAGLGPDGYVSYDRLMRCVRYAIKQGADVIGLGALSTGIGEFGYGQVGYGKEVAAYANKFGVAVDTGNDYTVTAGKEAGFFLLRKMGYPLSECVVSIVGATGAIGKALVKAYAPRVRQVLVASRDLEKARALCKELNLPNAQPMLLENSVGDSQLTITCTAANEQGLEDILTPDKFRSGSILIVLSRPRDLGKAVSDCRDDVFVTDGALVRVPGANVTIDLDYDPEIIYPCMTQTLLHAAMGYPGNVGCTPDLPEKEIELVESWAAECGVELCLTDDSTYLRRNDKPIKPEELDEFRRRYVEKPRSEAGGVR